MIRKAFLMDLKSGHQKEYESRHNPIWPELRLFSMRFFILTRSDCGRVYGELSVRRCSSYSRIGFSIGFVNKNYGELTVRRTLNRSPI